MWVLFLAIVEAGSKEDGVDLSYENGGVKEGEEGDSDEEEEDGFGANEKFDEEDLMIGIEGGGKGGRGVWGEEGFDEEGEGEDEGGEENGHSMEGKRMKDVGDKRRKNVTKEGTLARKKKVKTSKLAK